MTAPSVSVGLRKGLVFVVSACSPGPGTYIDKAPVTKCLATDVAEIGKNVLNGLREFAEDGPWPDWKTYRSPVLDAAEVTSWSQYERGLKSCVVSLNEDHLLIRSELPHLTVPHDATHEEIGTAVLKSLGIAT